MGSPPVPVVSSREVAAAPQVPAPEIPAPEIPAPQTFVCMNCGTQLAGKYCSACGQRHEPHVHTLGHFLSEAFESITHADSRLWRTLGYLLVKPGRLTREFLDGHRVRYLPPFRLYLVISLLFFLVASATGFFDYDFNSGPAPERVQTLNQVAADMEAQVPDNPELGPVAANLRAQARQEQERIDKLKASGADAATVDRETRGKIEIGGCDEFSAPDPEADWKYALAHTFCKKVNHVSARELMVAVVHNIPRALFVLLPLLALLMKPLYWRPKRYYVEHLLFLVHNHAFVFVAFTLLVLTVGLPDDWKPVGYIQAFIWLYILWYLFRAMRVHYGQSRWLTTGKYLVMGLCYFTSAMLVLAFTFLVSALTL